MDRSITSDTVFSTPTKHQDKAMTSEAVSDAVPSEHREPEGRVNNEAPPIPGTGGHPIKQEVPEEAIQNEQIAPGDYYLLFDGQREAIQTDEELAQNYGPLQQFDDNPQNELAEDVAEENINQQPEALQEYNIEQDSGFDDHQAEHRHEMDGHLNQMEENGIERANQGRNEEVPNREARDLPPVENGHNGNRVPEIKQEVRDDNEQDNNVIQNVQREIKVEPNQNVDHHQEEHQQNMGEQRNRFGEIGIVRADQEENLLDSNGEINLQPAQDFIIKSVAVKIPPRNAWISPDSPEEIARALAKPLATRNELANITGVIYGELNQGQLHVNKDFITLLSSKKFNEEALIMICDMLSRIVAFILEQIEQKARVSEDSLSPFQALCCRILDSYMSVTVTFINDELTDSYRQCASVLDTIARYRVIKAKCETSARDGANEANCEASTRNKEKEKNIEALKNYADEVAKQFRSAVLGTSYSEVFCFYLVYCHLQDINATYEEDVDFDHLPTLQDFDNMHARSIYLSSMRSFNYVYRQKLEASAIEARNSRRTEKDKKYEAFLICCLLENEPIATHIWDQLLKIYISEAKKLSKLIKSNSKAALAKRTISCESYDKLASDFKIFQRIKIDQINNTFNANEKSYHLDHLYLSLIRIDIFRYRYTLNDGNAGTNDDIQEVIVDGMNALIYVEKSIVFPVFVREAMSRFEFIFDAGLPKTWEIFNYIFLRLPEETKTALAKCGPYRTLLRKYRNHPMMAQFQNRAVQPMINDDDDDEEPERIDQQEGVEMMEDDFGFDNAIEDAPVVHPIRAIPNDHEHTELLDAPMEEDIEMAPVVDAVLRATRNQNKHHRQAFNKTMEMYSEFAANRTFRFDINAAPIQPNRLQNDNRDEHAMEED